MEDLLAEVVSNLKLLEAQISRTNRRVDKDVEIIREENERLTGMLFDFPFQKPKLEPSVNVSWFVG